MSLSRWWRRSMKRRLGRRLLHIASSSARLLFHRNAADFITYLPEITDDAFTIRYEWCVVRRRGVSLCNGGYICFSYVSRCTIDFSRSVWWASFSGMRAQFLVPWICSLMAIDRLLAIEHRHVSACFLKYDFIVTYYPCPKLFGFHPSNIALHVMSLAAHGDFVMLGIMILIILLTERNVRDCYDLYWLPRCRPYGIDRQSQ